MITDRDIELFKFINRYGKTYNDVLGRTFFSSPITSAKRINVLKKQGLISFWNTKLQSPRRLIVLTNETQEFLQNEHDIKAKNPKLNVTTIHHNMIEQLADFWLQKIGSVERTTTATHNSELHHVPDFIFTSKNGQKFNIEVELSKKSIGRYKTILLNTKKDNIDGILYIVRTKEDIQRFKEFLPLDNRLLFIDIDSLIYNIKESGKIDPIAQSFEK
jgi:hypothetical protein